ncbi:hypothetical protein EVAR_76147_1 [Eumeta japonica]|uniref:Uncharacterized protein n=1 Tax=Eumeta variegata TaxID=151549 RepID=A0A4C1UXV6_EUMVA|nr:hypothetical protein EVAR_76147_1 [Eumeta japonica]
MAFLDSCFMATVGIPSDSGSFRLGNRKIALAVSSDCEVACSISVNPLESIFNPLNKIFVVEMQIRGSAVGFMRHVNACCRQASSITVTRYVKHRGETKSRRYTKKLGSRSSCLGRCLVSPRGTMCMSGDWMRIRKSCVFRKIPPAFQYTTHKSDDARRGRGVSL